MKRRIFFQLLVTVVAFLMSSGRLVAQATNGEPTLQWFDARNLCIEGKGWSETKSFFDRLPARAEGRVRENVWNLSHDSSGMCVRFATDATAISARWTLRKKELAMAHMPATGVSGVDLYVKDHGHWRWLANGRPLKTAEEKNLVKGLERSRREFMLYLPLYNGVTEVQLGVPPDASLQSAPPRVSGAKPVVFYGTSILQGGCASRPGMAYPALLGRRLDWPTVNLGFSGNAWSEPEVADLIAELETAAFVLDPLPNMTPSMVKERIEPFVRTLRRAHPHVPIVLVENLTYTDSDFVSVRREKVEESNANLRAAFANLRRAGVARLYYVPGKKLLGDDGEATVDGTHPTDLGFLRMADAIEPILRRALKTVR